MIAVWYDWTISVLVCGFARYSEFLAKIQLFVKWVEDSFVSVENYMLYIG